MARNKNKKVNKLAAPAKKSQDKHKAHQQPTVAASQPQIEARSEVATAGSSAEKSSEGGTLLCSPAQMEAFGHLWNECKGPKEFLEKFRKKQADRKKLAEEREVQAAAAQALATKKPAAVEAKPVAIKKTQALTVNESSKMKHTPGAKMVTAEEGKSNRVYVHDEACYDMTIEEIYEQNPDYPFEE